MKIYCPSGIRALRPKPCYDPTRHVAETWTGTLADILRLEHATTKDRIWVATASSGGVKP